MHTVHVCFFRQQKRELESKLRELEERQQLLNQSAAAASSDPGQMAASIGAVQNGFISQPPSNYPPGITNGFSLSDSAVRPGVFNGMQTSASHQQPSVGIQNGYPMSSVHSIHYPHMTNGFRVPTVSSNFQHNGFTVTQPQVNGHVGQFPQSLQPPMFPANQSLAASTGLNQFQPAKLASSGPFSSTVPTEVPRTFLTPSLPIPSTISMSMSTSSDRPSDHLKKVKEYQLALLQRHEQSKKVLAETRAEIERRRQELMERFPQLELRTSEADSASSGSQSQGQQTKDPKLLTGNSLSPNKAAMASLLSQLASQPYYSSRLANGGEQSKSAMTEQPAVISNLDNKTDTGAKKLDNVRKSLPFDADDTIHVTPDIRKPGKPFFGPSPGSTTDDMNDTVISSSTEHSSPALPIGRSSGYTTGTESEQDKSLLSVAKERNDFFEQRQNELKKQLEEIQRQKEEILQRHQVGHLKLHTASQLPEQSERGATVPQHGKGVSVQQPRKGASVQKKEREISPPRIVMTSESEGKRIVSLFAIALI